MVIICDGHNDTVHRLLEYHPDGIDFLIRSSDGPLELPRALDGGLTGGLFAMFVHPERRPTNELTVTKTGYEVRLADPLDTNYRSRTSTRKNEARRCAMGDRRPLPSVTRPSAVPMRRPQFRTTPSAVIWPVSGVIGRTREILNSSVVWLAPLSSIDWMANPMQLSSSVAVRPPCTVPAGFKWARSE